MNHEFKAGTIHKSNKCGNVLITNYVSSKKINIVFLETGNERFVSVSNLLKGVALDRKEMNRLKNSTLSQSRLKRFLKYDPITGIFTRNISMSQTKKGDVAGCKSRGYLTISIDDKLYLAHRLAWLYVNGEFPKNQIDHINHVKDDNRIDNLRDVTDQENMKNLRKRKDNTSGVNGVWFSKQKGKWIAEIMLNKIKIHLGTFSNLTDAEISRKMAEQKYGYHKHHGE